ncbi:hypothetical protein SUGI_0242270 [Cryptomeria japonica]|nr:hypothetical protein SUGI_0242270 [Cryptomeria japonica]
MVRDTDDETQVAARDLRTKKEYFMGNAWDVFRAGVSSGELGPFRRMMKEDMGWLGRSDISTWPLLRLLLCLTQKVKKCLYRPKLQLLKLWNSPLRKRVAAVSDEIDPESEKVPVQAESLSV